MSQIYIGIFDEHRLFREAVCGLLKNISDIEVVATADSAGKLHEELKTKTIHVLVLHMPSMNPFYISLIKEISALYPRTRILVYNISDNEEIILSTIKAGSKGYLSRDSGLDDLAEAIYTLRNGHDYYSKSITSLLVKQYVGKLQTDDTKNNEGIKSLTAREIEILKLWGNSYTNPEIAEKLFISVRTVESHKNHIMQKLNLKTTVDMVKYAVRNNIIDI